MKLAFSFLLVLIFFALVIIFRPQNYVGGIVPHHDTANLLIDQFFQKIKTYKKINVYLVGPDHSESNNINDHSILVPSKFIKKYLPNSKIIPYVLKRNTPLEELKSLSEKITPEIKKGSAVIIASVDFSHNLTPQEANIKDEETLTAIKNFDYQKLMSLNSDYLDSPASVVTLLMNMESLNKKNFEILSHTNSAKLLGSSVTNTTSYFTILF